MDSDYNSEINHPNTLNHRKQISLLVYYLNKQGILKSKISLKDLVNGLELLFGFNKNDFENDLIKFNESLTITNRSRDYEQLIQFLESLSHMVKFDMNRHLWESHLV